MAAGGPAILKGDGKGKGGNKGGKNGGPKGGPQAWPSQAQWKTMYPGPSPTQWNNWYSWAGQGKANLFEAPHQLSSLQSLFQGPSAYSIVPKNKAAKQKTAANQEPPSFETGNRFKALTEDVDIKDLIKAPSRNQLRREAKQAEGADARRGAKVVSADPLASLPVTGRPGYRRTASADADSGVRGDMGLPADEAQPAETPKNPILEFVRTTFRDLKNAAKKENSTRPSARIFNEVCRQGSLRPLAPAKALDTKNGKFEVLSAIVDSGATIPVMSPETGEAYDLQESEASKNDVEYEVASGDTLPNLGEKKMAVLTAEGTLRGYTSQCADVSKPLQAVRALLESKHAVCFGLGDGDDHLVINKVSGEINRLRDDGINYLQDLLIVPPDKIEQVVKEMNALHENHEHPEPASGFGRQGR